MRFSAALGEPAPTSVDPSSEYTIAQTYPVDIVNPEKRGLRGDGQWYSVVCRSSHTAIQGDRVQVVTNYVSPQLGSG